MKRKIAYFRLLGFIEFIGFLAGLIYCLILMFTNQISVLVGVLSLILIIIFGPAMAILLFDHANLLEVNFPDENVSPKVNVDAFKDNDFPSGTHVVLKDNYEKDDISIAKGIEGIVVGFVGDTLSVKFTISGEEIIINESKYLFEINRYYYARH